MLFNLQVFIVCLLLIIIEEFQIHLTQETSNLQSNGTIDTTRAENSLRILEIKRTVSADSTTYDTNLHNGDANTTYNRSLEYLIEEPNTTIRRHEQEVIIKPLNYLKMESFQELLLKSANEENKSAQELNGVQPTLVISNVTASQMDKMITSGNEKKEVLIINLLNPQNQVPVRATAHSLKDNQIEEMTTPSNEVREALSHVSLDKDEKAATSFYDQEQQLPFKATNIDKQLTEAQPEDEKKEDVLFKSINLIKQYPTTNEDETTTANYDREISTTPKMIEKQIEDFENEDYKKESLIQKPLAQESIISAHETNNKVVQTLVETIVETPGGRANSVAEESSEENNNLTPKPLVSLEDYAVKQMDFILDHMLLESQEFVAKVLQATGNTLFHRDPLKRYAENLNNLLNPQPESDYSDEIYIPSLTIPQDDVYEEVIKKINFLKSKTTKELQRHLPANWIKEYQDKKEELKIWLNKASDEMHRVFNFYVDEEEDHIRYLYFNEAFDDIARATEIHQKLALLADLIKIVKNKKQITFMDLYMQ